MIDVDKWYTSHDVRLPCINLTSQLWDGIVFGLCGQYRHQEGFPFLLDRGDRCRLKVNTASKAFEHLDFLQTLFEAVYAISSRLQMPSMISGDAIHLTGGPSQHGFDIDVESMRRLRKTRVPSLVLWHT